MKEGAEEEKAKESSIKVSNELMVATSVFTSFILLSDFAYG